MNNNNFTDNNNNNNNIEGAIAHEFSCGIELTSVTDIQESTNQAYDNGYQFLVVPISHPRFNRDFTQSSNIESNNKLPFTRSDTLLESSHWKSVIVGKTSDYLDLDSKNDLIRKNSTLTLKQEISWAAHLSLPSILIQSPGYMCPNFSQVIYQTLHSLTYMRIWIRIPLESPKKLILDQQQLPLTIQDNTWEWWNNLRLFCNHHPSLFPVIELTSNLPNETILDQWLGEPIKCIIIPTNVFLTNQAGYPTLSKKHQKFLKKVFQHNIQFVLTGADAIDSENYLIYLKYLHSNQSRLTDQDLFEQPYLDYLQSPLQPLMDNLESQTYEIFEKDPVKYYQYQVAIGKALLDLKQDETDPVIMVVGAGRGPLVKSAILASLDVKKSVRIFAVEKNPNAIVTLRNRIIVEGWENIVTIVDSDMREWNTVERANIIVSELLGSFGDNELSPECLDGVQRFLKTDGVSIPSWYTSYLAPISSSKLFNEVATFGDIKHFETPYVVKPHNYNQLAESKPLFTFVHPNRESPIDNNRFDSLEFDVHVNSTLHGFIGFFDCCLYKDVHISINPKNFSTSMFSWFPIYFPIQNPIYLSNGGKVVVHFWRLSNRTKVWYEWTVSQPQVTPISNSGGSGPAGLYTANRVHKRIPHSNITIIERFPFPFGLIRLGIAPDHQNEKKVKNTLEKVFLENPQTIKFVGNIDIEKDITFKQIQDQFHAIVLACGIDGEKLLNIPRESDFTDIYSARDFISWLNGHPKLQNREFNLSNENIAIIGQGNVALDVARLICKEIDILKTTDITSKAINVHIIGRRGPLEVSFTNKEIRELLTMPNVNVYINDIKFLDIPEEKLNNLERQKKRTFELFKKYLKPIEELDVNQNEKRNIIFHFCRSPTEFKSNESDESKLGSVVLEKNRLVLDEKTGQYKAVGTKEYESLNIGTVFRSIGYVGIKFNEIPFDYQGVRVPNKLGKVLTSTDQQQSSSFIPGMYVSGWMKTGPSGSIVNIANDTEETADQITIDYNDNSQFVNQVQGYKGVLDCIKTTGRHRIITFDDWKKIEKQEEERGKEKEGFEVEIGGTL
eukprot:gene8395-10311_t